MLYLRNIIEFATVCEVLCELVCCFQGLKCSLCVCEFLAPKEIKEEIYFLFWISILYYYLKRFYSLIKIITDHLRILEEPGHPWSFLEELKKKKRTLMVSYLISLRLNTYLERVEWPSSSSPGTK